MSETYLQRLSKERETTCKLESKEMWFKRKMPLFLRAKIHYLLWLLKTYRTRRKCATSHNYDPSQIYWISPDRIQLTLDSPAFDRLALAPNRKIHITPLLERGKVVGGDWDLKAICFEDMDAWKAFHHRFVIGGKWNETSFYARIVKTIEGGIAMWRCKSIKEFDIRLKQIDILFEDIKNKGYRSQMAIKDFKSCGNEDEVNVHIGRSGDYIFADGRHRLCIAKILKLDKIPVKVARRHQEWVSFRHEILTYAKKSSRLYARLTHPDLSDIPAAHAHERMELIKNHLPDKSGIMLDIGAHWGYFCHCFEDLGFQCVAVENSPINLQFMKKLRRAENKCFEIVEKSILKSDLSKFDVVLALNIFHHFLKKEKTYQELICFLEKLNARIMFFEPHLPDEPQMKSSLRNYNPEEFTEFVRVHGHFNSASKIGVSPDGRPLFKLTR